LNEKGKKPAFADGRLPFCIYPDTKALFNKKKQHRNYLNRKCMPNTKIKELKDFYANQQ
jgi:hypothetical protein